MSTFVRCGHQATPYNTHPHGGCAMCKREGAKLSMRNLRIRRAMEEALAECALLRQSSSIADQAA